MRRDELNSLVNANFDFQLIIQFRKLHQQPGKTEKEGLKRCIPAEAA